MDEKEVFSINVSGFSAQEKQDIKIAAVKANKTLGEYCHDLLVKQS
jgi:hypothetical protein